MPRWLVTLMLVAAAGFLAWAMAIGSRRSAEQDAETTPETAPETVEAAQPVPPVPDIRESELGDTLPPPVAAPTSATQPLPPASELVRIAGLHVVQPERQPEPIIGDASGDEGNPFRVELKLTPWGAGIIEARLSRYSLDVPLHEDDFSPYTVQRRLVHKVTRDGIPVYRYPMAAKAVEVNGSEISLADQVWTVASSDKASAHFTLTLADADGMPVLELHRVWRVTPGNPENIGEGYGITLEQRVINKSGQPLSIRYSQFGPMDAPKEQGYIGDQRHVILGHLHPRRASEEKYVTTEGFDLPRQKVMDPAVPERLWPPAGEIAQGRDLLWTAVTNRYFTAVVHAPTTTNDPPKVRILDATFPIVRRDTWGEGKPDDQTLALVMDSAEATVAAGESRTFDLVLFVGPKSRHVLDESPAYSALGLSQIIVYNLGGCCSMCTFAWLANGLFAFLGFFHGLLMDWGMAIILLVAVVRTILHPLTKGSQVNMMKLSKQMQALQPELDKLKKKYKDNTSKLNQEMMALYREKGVNPASMGLGCLPMFLQMPIWIALYAMLYFAIELRHEPAFWGVFQKISGGSWPFLADLSSQDAFLPLPASMHFTVPLINQQLTAINILPILMGIVFFVQQKYMTPANPNMSPEMRQQQTMMKWMMVTLFPLMLFWAPSGLTLYILTSTAVGIVESKRVRKHIKELEDSGKLHEKKERKPGGIMDRLMKAAEARQKLMEEQAKHQQRSGKKKNRNKP